MIVSEVTYGYGEAAIGLDEPIRCSQLVFNREADPIAALYGRLLPITRLPFGKAVINLSDRPNWVEPQNIYHALGVLTIPAAPAVTADDDANTRRVKIATAIRDALVWVCAINEWDSTPFEEALERCLECGLINEWYLWQGKWVFSPSRKRKARVFVKYDPAGVDVQIEVASKDETTVVRHQAALIRSGMYGLWCAAKGLRWKNDSRIVLVARSSKASISLRV
jgi:hypothetical protein